MILVIRESVEVMLSGFLFRGDGVDVENRAQRNREGGEGRGDD